MHIDWFTVIAQAINFLVLMWLLKRFLYKPILNAIAAREKNIADRFADAKAKENAAEKEQADFKKKSDAFDKQKTVLMTGARKEAVAAREKLLTEAQEEADALRVQCKEALKDEERDLSQEIITRTKQEIFAVAAKALHDLADVSLEAQMCTVFVAQLQSLPEKEKQTLVAAFKDYSPSTFIASAFTLSPAQRKEIKAALHKISGANKEKLQFKVVPELVSGIELSVSGHKLAWSIADYLEALEKSVDESFTEKPGASHAA